MPLFSVISVTYNNLKGLQNTFKSLRLQTFTDYEWIVVDGGSYDGTLDFLSDKPCKLISEKDDGIYDAMNKGIGKANGDYLIFMNAGDVFADADILEIVQDTIIENPDFI